MPVTYRFDANIVIIELVGEYTMGDIPATINKALADAQCPVTPFILTDLSESISIGKRSSNDVITMALSLVHWANILVIVLRWLLQIIYPMVLCAWAAFSLKNRE